MLELITILFGGNKMKLTINGLEVYNLTNEFQIYDNKTLVRRVFKSGNANIDKQRLFDVISTLL